MGRSKLTINLTNLQQMSDKNEHKKKRLCCKSNINRKLVISEKDKISNTFAEEVFASQILTHFLRLGF